MLGQVSLSFQNFKQDVATSFYHRRAYRTISTRNFVNQVLKIILFNTYIGLFAYF